MNKVILIGRLARDPELRTTPSNISVARFSIAVSRPFSSQNNGQPDADFINCTVWRKQAENLAKYCHKGSQIAIEGRIQTGSYTAQDGSKRYTTEVVCDNITFLSSKSENQGYASGNSNGYNNNGGYSNPMPEFVDQNYQQPDVQTTDINDNPYDNFGEEVTLSDDDLPF